MPEQTAREQAEAALARHDEQMHARNEARADNDREALMRKHLRFREGFKPDEARRIASSLETSLVAAGFRRHDREVTDAEVEAAAEAVYDRGHAYMLNGTDAAELARAALEAARKVAE